MRVVSHCQTAVFQHSLGIKHILIRVGFKLGWRYNSQAYSRLVELRKSKAQVNANEGASQRTRYARSDIAHTVQEFFLHIHNEWAQVSENHNYPVLFQEENAVEN